MLISLTQQTKPQVDGQVTATPQAIVKGDFSMLAFMANVDYDFDTGSRWVPYVGGGLGVATISIDTETAHWHVARRRQRYRLCVSGGRGPRLRVSLGGGPFGDRQPGLAIFRDPGPDLQRGRDAVAISTSESADMTSASGSFTGSSPEFSPASCCGRRSTRCAGAYSRKPLRHSVPLCLQRLAVRAPRHSGVSTPSRRSLVRNPGWAARGTDSVRFAAKCGFL